MKSRLQFILTAILLGTLMFAACTEDQGPEPGTVTVSGTVTDAATGAPVAGVTVRGQLASSAPLTVLTDAQGLFTIIFEIDSVAQIVITTSKAAYRDTTIQISVRSGVPFPLNILLTPRSPVGSGGGSAQTIAFLGADPQQISVYGVGGQETSILGWEVRDSLGFPIDAAHGVTLTFTVIGGLNGGEYVSPVALTTNSAGRAFTTFNSGIRSGVVQIVASTTIGGRTISSGPVRVVINAGFPDQSHFTIGPSRLNFPTLGYFNRTNAITVLIGDKYSNPVVSNTAVYFRSSAGVIQASGFTNSDGLATVNLISGNPRPFGANAANPPGDGYHYVVARTLGEGGAPVQDSVLILWSGTSRISEISPATFDITNGQFQDFTFTVSDELGHPLSAGTTISVEATVSAPPDPNTPVNQVQLSFGIRGSITLPDIIFPGPGRTEFSFRLSDGTISVDEATPVTISVSVTSAGNENAYRSINGTVR